MDRVWPSSRLSGLLRFAPLAAAERMACAAAPVAFSLVFAVAWVLKPDERGLGTHEQLGLLPCVSVRILGIPCPFCGMTTAFSHFAHGEPLMAFQTQPAGALFFVAAACASVAGAAFALSGKWWPALGSPAFSRRVLQIALVLVVVAWLYKILAYRF